MGSVNLTAALAVLVECGIFNKIPKTGAIGSRDLADAVDIDESVVQRAMRLVCTQGIGEELAPNVYAHNAKSLEYITGNGQYMFRLIREYEPVYQGLPRYFKSHTKDAFKDVKQTPYAWTHGLEGKTYYEAIAADPYRIETFSNAMAHLEAAIPTLGMYPFSSLKYQVEAEPQRPFIVDVGGGNGNVLRSIQTEAPTGFGAEMVLQDLPHVIDAIDPNSIPGITKMAHDFNTPQPIKNAHLYFLRRVLHNYQNEQCKIILNHIADAMGLTSRLLIGDFILPDQATMDDDFMARWLDFAMITLAGKERTLGEFEELLDAAGLDLVKVWPYKNRESSQSVIEARLSGPEI